MARSFFWALGLVLIACNGRSFSKDPPEIFSCKTASEKWQATIEFSETDQPSISFATKKGDGEKSRTRCRSPFESFLIAPADQVPHLQAVLVPASCNLSPELKAEILDKIYLRVNKTSGKYSALLQWLKSSQPEACTVTHLDSVGMKRMQTRWREGNLN